METALVIILSLGVVVLGLMVRHYRNLVNHARNETITQRLLKEVFRARLEAKRVPLDRLQRDLIDSGVLQEPRRGEPEPGDGDPS